MISTPNHSDQSNHPKETNQRLITLTNIINLKNAIIMMSLAHLINKIHILSHYGSKQFNSWLDKSLLGHPTKICLPEDRII